MYITENNQELFKESIHIPVLLEESINLLITKKNGIYIDGTFGLGSHSLKILDNLKSGTLVAFELEKTLFLKGKLTLENKENKSVDSIILNSNFKYIESELKKLNINSINGVLLDLGLCSFQLEDKELNKGFSYRIEDAKLNMVISENYEKDAYNVLNTYSKEELADIFFNYGEERKSRVIASSIIRNRERKPIENTSELISIIASSFKKKGKKHPAKRVFQALRIYLNDELENLKKVINDSLELIQKNGRLVIISYHSLEDRIVKHLFKAAQASGNFKILTKKPIIPTKEEIKNNHRSRSAKLRVIEKV